MILVVATGNDYSVPLASAQKKLNGVLVGNLGPLGVMNYGSRDGEEVTIAAPSSNMLLSITSKDDGSVIDEDGVHNFGGTSGAAPLVTGALANAVSILGDLRTHEAKTLLCKTAVPTLQSRQRPSRNGCGMVNAYKLVRAADALKKKGWPKNRDSLLKDEHLFDFAKEAKVNHEEARRLLQSQSCDDKRKAFRLLRTAYLLQPFQSIADDLARIYSEAGLEFNASFYLITGPEGPRIAERAIFDPSWSELNLPRSDDVKLTPQFETSMLRALPAFGLSPSIDKLLDRALKINDIEISSPAIRAYIERSQRPLIGNRLEALYKSHPHLRQSLLYIGLEPHVSTRAFFCKEALANEEWDNYLSSIVKASDAKCDAMAADSIENRLPKLPDYRRESVSSKVKYDAEVWRAFFARFPKAKAAFENAPR